ncbi:helix-turn-helix transcriptional regulator [Fulvivirgaceae bacterium BMA10]|uniref:Helix-turn-helix transcriptional regulator n=1 Tax=Splendidivirga corallicola TaxID=3051826 RepID=A0ABT8KXW3_9BACT|nr:helix-turn-helix transcriptional regulator [Fulvivirgaceae bacterium BMA10]
MKGKNLGEFEEIVLLTVGVLYDNAYSVAICDELQNQTGRSVNISAVHSALYRLESKGYLDSRLGEASATRGGKRKRKFTITSLGKKALDETMDIRLKLRNQIPDIAFNFGFDN